HTPASYANLMTNGFTASLTTIDTLTAVIQVFTSTSTTMFVGNPNWHCPAASPNYCPGAVRLYFTSNLPQAGMSSCLGLNGNSQHAVVANEFDYWWSNTQIRAMTGLHGNYLPFSPTCGGT